MTISNKCREVIRDERERENETRTRDGEGRKSRGSGGGVREGRPWRLDSCICHNLIWLHNRIPARRDHPCQQVTYFFYSTSPFLHDRLRRSSSYCYDFVAANSRRLFDPLSPRPPARWDAWDTSPGSFRNNPPMDSRTERKFAKFSDGRKAGVYEWTTDAMKFLIWRENGRQMRRCANGPFVLFHLDP